MTTLRFDITNNASKGLGAVMDALPVITRKAIKSTGYQAMQAIQEGIKSGAPGGDTYAEFFPQKYRRALDQIIRGRGKSDYKPMGKLAQATKYRYMNTDARGMSVVVGWLSNSSANIGRKQQDGYIRPMTDAMRKSFDDAFEKLGMKTRIAKTTTQLTVPSRPTMAPMEQVLEPVLSGIFETAFKKNLKEYTDAL